MSLFIELVTAPFASHDLKSSSLNARRAGSPSVRRPQRGLEIKEDTYAVLKVVGPDGKPINLISSSSNAGGGTTTEYANFMLQRVSDARMEKQQILETFGESYIFFFGEQPRFLDVQAVLVDSLDFNWYTEFWENYEKYFRGTKLVEMGARIYLMYDDIVVEGYMLNAQAEKTSETPLMASLAFRLFVTNYYSVSLTDNSAYPLHWGASIDTSGLNVQPLPALTDPYANAGSLLGNLSDGLRGASQQLGVLSKISDYAGVDGLSEALARGQQGTNAIADFTGVVQNVATAAENLFGSKPPRDAALYYRDPSVPLRSNIEDNSDEYTIDAFPIMEQPPPKADRRHSLLENVEDLALKSITLLKQVGAANSNFPNLMKSLGLRKTNAEQPTAFGVVSSPGTLHP